MPKNKEQIRVAFYIRVSTTEQARHGYGVEMQLDALKETVNFKNKYSGWITKDDWIFIDDGYTGAKLDRPGYKRMMEMAKQGHFDVVAVWKIDRMSRNLTHLLKVFEDLQKYGVSFYSLKENVDFSGSIGKLTFQIFGALAEFERETIRSRTLEGRIASAKLGNVVSGTPAFGYEQIKKAKEGKGSTYKILKKEAKWVLKVYEWFVFDEISYSEVARHLNKFKVPKGEGSPHRKTKKFSNDEGEYEEIEVEIPQIIPEPLFRQAKYRVQMISESKGKKGGGQNLYLLSRKIIDLETTRKFIGYSRTKGGSGYRRKGFKLGKISYKNKEIPGKPLEDFVWEQIMLAINKPEEFFKIYKKQRYNHRELERLKDKQKFYRNEAVKANDALQNVFDDYYEGNLAEKRKTQLEIKYEERIGNYKKEINKIETQIKRIGEIKIASDVLERFSKYFKKRINNFTFEQKRLLIEMLVDKIEVFEDEKNIKVNVFFRFAQESKKPAIVVDEPKKGLSKTKNTPNGVSSDNGGGCTGTRTPDPLGVNEML